MIRISFTSFQSLLLLSLFKHPSRRSCVPWEEVLRPLEHIKLRARKEVLQRNQRNFMGGLDSFSLEEPQNLEHQLHFSLKHIRSRKNQLMFELISDLQKKVILHLQNQLMFELISDLQKKREAPRLTEAGVEKGRCMECSRALIEEVK